MGRIIDYKYKSFVLKTNMHKHISFLDKSFYLYAHEGIIPSIDLDEEYKNMYDEYGAKFIKECHRINDATYKRVTRLKNRIQRYLELGKCIFVTLTFNDETLDQTSESTRRKYVQRCLKDNSDYYVANIDYGVDDKYSHREHYHALVQCDKFDKKSWSYGFSFCEVVHKTEDDLKLSKYISKLSNHAIKDSTKRACYIYSRN